MKHCLLHLYQVCLVGDHKVQNGPAVGDLGFENEICLKIFSRTARPRCLKIGFTKVCSNSGPRIQNGPAAGGPGFEP